MIKISVEGATTLELSLKLLEIGRLLAAEPVPHASEGVKPYLMNDAPKPAAKPRKEKPGNVADGAGKAADAPAGTTSLASTPTAGADVPPTPTPAEEPPAPAPAAAPAVDSEAVRAELRALLSSLVRAGKQPQVNELVTSYAPALSQVPADKLVELKQKAEAL